jgi:hypothetical protein
MLDGRAVDDGRAAGRRHGVADGRGTLGNRGDLARLELDLEIGVNL